MKLRRKASITIGVTIISLLAVLFIASNIILGNSYLRLEEQYAQKSVDQAIGAINNDIAALDTKLSDWAKWDDTYKFIEDENEAYIISNLGDTAFDELDINVMVFLNTKGSIVFSKGFDLVNHHEVDVSGRLQEMLKSEVGFPGIIAEKQGISGIVMLPEGPMIIASQPILNSSGEGDSRGVLLMGRLLDASVVEKIKEQTKLIIEITSLETKNSSRLNQTAQNALLGGERVFVQAPDDWTVNGFSLIEDIYHKPALLLHVQMEREIFRQGKTSRNFFAVSMLVSGVIIGFIIVLALEKIVLSRLSLFTKKVGEIGEKGDLAERVALQGNDELTELSREVNRMLEALEKSHSELQKAKEDAEHANRVKGEFLANMSHEIRTPINAIQGMTELLRDTSLDQAQRELAATVNEAGELLLNIVNDILDFSKMEAGRMALNTYSFQIAGTVESVAQLMEIKARQKGLKLSVAVEPVIPDVNGDADRLRQILINLIGNAVKFTEKGTISIGASVISEQADGINVRFEITDTGIGIREEVQKRLFQPFEQADGSMSRKYGGTGLGLSICKQLVEMMKGKIGIKSVPGTGSTFWFEIPFQKATEEVVTERNHSSDDNPIGSEKVKEEIKRILVVEDNKINRELATMQLKKLGFKVDTAVNGQEALECLEQVQYHLVFMDCQMPVMDGFEAVGEIRRREAGSGRHIPVIAMTANALQGDREKCLTAGMDDYITKPVRMDVLNKVLNKWKNKYMGDTREEVLNATTTLQV